MKGERLYLIDGHSLIFRMYYAFLRRPMINSASKDVSILYGVTKYILELVQREKPDCIAVCFDPPGKTFRHTLFPLYKATRQATPELVIEALEPMIGICNALEIPVLMVPGFEGDDVLGSAAVRAASEGYDVYMVTPDKDFGQLICDNIRQYKSGKAGAENEIIDRKTLCERLGISDPRQVIDMLAICGDSADNIPGVDGVGEVGASRLISKYGSVENIYAHIDELPPRQAEMFRKASDHIGLSKTLATIKTDVELPVKTSEMKLCQEHGPRVFELFDEYEFPSLKKFLKASPDVALTPVAAGKDVEWLESDKDSVIRAALSSGLCSVRISADGEEGVFATPCRVGIAARDKAGGKIVAASGKLEEFALLLGDKSVSKAGLDLKAACTLMDNSGVALEGSLLDIELMHYLVNPEKSHRPDVLARSYLGVTYDIAQEQEKSSADAGAYSESLFPEDGAADSPGLFNCVEDSSRPASLVPELRRLAIILMLGEELDKELGSLDLLDLYHKIEEPLIRVLAGMERAGVQVNMSTLKEYAAGLAEEIASLESKLRRDSGIPDLNPSSPKQIGAMLFETLRIDPSMKKKASYPTDEETLMSYAEANPIIYDILDYRGLKKLLGTYIEPFGNWVSPRDGRVHTTFNQALTATGRLSSSRPNLQNIPIRTERGRLIRKAFSASSDDKVIISADYSQIELRLMAHFCQDAHLLEAFRNGQDVHAATAAKIYGVPLEQVSDQMRRTAKTANFGIMYGISAFGLAQRLHIPRVAAKKIIEDYFEAFPSIRVWIDKVRDDASRDGYVQTLFGRRRYLPDINSRNATVRGLALRNAVNAPIQGTAADIIKLAMITVQNSIESASLKSRMVLQIHDELLFEAPKSELDTLMKIVRDGMENVVELSVPLTVECNYGENWLEAH